MTPILGNVLFKINSGGWIFSDLQHLFFAALEKKIEIPSGIYEPLLAYEGISLKKNPNSNLVNCNSFLTSLDYEKFQSENSELGVITHFNDEEKAHLNNSLKLFRISHPIESKLFDSVFYGFARAKEGHFSGSSNPRAWGIFFLGDRFFELTLDEKILSFVHEMAHQELFLINLLDRLADKAYDSSLAYSPLQKCLRPPIRRLHSFWALFRMLQFACKNNVEHFKLKNDFDMNLSTFKDNELTNFGEKLIQAVQQCLNSQFQYPFFSEAK